MKLTMNNILFVKRLEHNDVTYSWFVAMKSRRISDARNYINVENGKTVIKEYPAEWLPKTVQNFISTYSETKIVDGDEFKVYMISREAEVSNS